MKNELHIKITPMPFLSCHSMLINNNLQLAHLVVEANKIK